MLMAGGLGVACSKLQAAAGSRIHGTSSRKLIWGILCIWWSRWRGAGRVRGWRSTILWSNLALLTACVTRGGTVLEVNGALSRCLGALQTVLAGIIHLG